MLIERIISKSIEVNKRSISIDLYDNEDLKISLDESISPFLISLIFSDKTKSKQLVLALKILFLISLLKNKYNLQIILEHFIIFLILLIKITEIHVIIRCYKFK